MLVTLETYEGIGKGAVKQSYASLVEGIRAFQQTDEARIPRLLREQQMLIWHDPDLGNAVTFADKHVELVYRHLAIGKARNLKYTVVPAGVFSCQIMSREGVILGGRGYTNMTDAFAACDRWNCVPPGTSALCQAQAYLGGEGAPLARISIAYAELHSIGKELQELEASPDRAPGPDYILEKCRAYTALMNEFIELSAYYQIEMPANAKKSSNEMVICNEDMDLSVSVADGVVKGASCRSEAALRLAAKISHFDIREAAEFNEQFAGSTDLSGVTFDIKAVGYWRNDGEYVSPCEDFRKELDGLRDFSGKFGRT